MRSAQYCLVVKLRPRSHFLQMVHPQDSYHAELEPYSCEADVEIPLALMVC